MKSGELTVHLLERSHNNQAWILVLLGKCSFSCYELQCGFLDLNKCSRIWARW